MTTQKRKVRGWIIPYFMLASLLCAGNVTAENDKDNPQQTVNQGDEQADDFEEPTYSPPADIEERLGSLKKPELERKYLTEKYPGLEKKETFSNLKQTEYGPLGKLHISGKIAPKGGWGGVLEGKENKDERARAIARAFIAEEVSIFGIFDMDELREYKFSRDELGNAHIKCQRYVGGLRVESSYIFIHVRPDETISSLMAEVVAPPCLISSCRKEDHQQRQGI
jgi:hypothetical protein